MTLYGEITADLQQCKIVLLDESNQLHHKWTVSPHDTDAALSLLAPHAETVRGLTVPSFKFHEVLVRALMKAGYRVYLANGSHVAKWRQPTPKTAITPPLGEGFLAQQLRLSVSKPHAYIRVKPWQVTDGRQALSVKLLACVQSLF